MPLFLNARHNSSCLHDYHLDTCPGKAKADISSGSSSIEERLSNLCFYWVAGTDLPAGAEVCVSYGHLRMDQAVLMYGLPAEEFAQGFASQEQPAGAEGSGPLWLHGMDTEEATADKPFGVVAAEPLQPWTPGEDYGMKSDSRQAVGQGLEGGIRARTVGLHIYKANVCALPPKRCPRQIACWVKLTRGSHGAYVG